ncbi:MAG: DUF4377 domain-containing protein [Aestuariibaculum sp.]
MKIKYLFLLLSIVTTLSCSKDDDNQPIKILWVNHERVDCQGVGEQTCYLIQENKSIIEDDWQLFYNTIEDFDEQYEAGYIYKISVTTLEIKNPPADSSSIKYVLNEILGKTAVE